ncbi:MAG: hypothetical protein IJ122_06460 [Methanobrevibacter sp.]|nr:hypothetical protein [Methanobrevibacter sp.]
MSVKTYEPGKISLTLHGITYSVEGLAWDIGGTELMQEFRGLMHASGFPVEKYSEEDEWIKK